MKMYKHKTRILLVLVLIFNISFAAICGRGARATIATATDDFAEAQISTANLLSNAKSTGLISQEDINEIKPFLLEANTLNGEAITLGRNLSKNGDVATRNELVEKLNAISSVLVRANNAGLTRIKDEKTRAAFSALIVVMQSAATSIIRLIDK